MTDPDGDRFAFAEKICEKWKIYDADEIAAIFVDHFLRNFKHEDLVFINTFYCNKLIEKIAENKKINFFQTETGFKNISRLIHKIRTKHENKIFLAYEDSLGFLLGNGTEKDGIASIVFMSEIISELEKVHKILDFTYEKYGLHLNYKFQIRVSNIELAYKIVKEILEESKIKHIDDNKKILCDLRNDYSFIVRASGTESMIKIYTSSTKLDYDKLKEYATAKVKDLFYDNSVLKPFILE
ncbi:hypothetical protein GVAV_003502 [Gurleya vavrai]